MKLGRILIVGIAAVAFASCCNCGKVSSAGGKLTGGQWQLVQMEGQSFRAMEDAYTLSFAQDNGVSGRGDCNRINGTFANDSKKGALSFGPIASTRMMCPNQANEDKFLRLLNEVDSYSIDGKMLMLFTKGELRLMMENKSR